MTLRRLALTAVLAASLAACASLPGSVAPGTPREQVLASLGPPTATWPLADGTRLQYSGQPAGRQVFNIDLDASGRVVRVNQALRMEWLRSLGAEGRWRTDDLLRELGRPAYTARVRSVDGEVWTWRFTDFASAPYLLHVDVDPQGVVQRIYAMLEPIRPWFGGD
jgi:hypothetical protein